MDARPMLLVAMSSNLIAMASTGRSFWFLRQGVVGRLPRHPFKLQVELLLLELYRRHKAPCGFCFLCGRAWKQRNSRTEPKTSRDCWRDKKQDMAVSTLTCRVV